MKCRDKDHQFFGNAGTELMHLKLVEGDGDRIHSCIRNIVLSASTGEMLDMRLINPIEGDNP